MATSHHGDENPSEFMKRFLKEIPCVKEPDEASKLRRYMEQTRGKATREYPHGRLNGDDDGSLAMVVTADRSKQVVVIDFGKPVTWIGLGPSDVEGLISLLQTQLLALQAPLTVSV